MKSQELSADCKFLPSWEIVAFGIELWDNAFGQGYLAAGRKNAVFWSQPDPLPRNPHLIG